MTENTPGTWGADDLPTPPPPTGSGPADPGRDPGNGEPSSRRRNLLIVAVAAGVVVLAGVGAALAGVFDTTEPAPAPAATTVTLASPTPTVPPAARAPISTFADALPGSVLQFALAGVVPQPTLVAAGALEG